MELTIEEFVLTIDEFISLRQIGTSDKTLAMLFAMRDLIVAGRRTHLIKLIRKETGLGLMPAKELVDVFLPQKEDNEPAED